MGSLLDIPLHLLMLLSAALDGSAPADDVAMSAPHTPAGIGQVTPERANPFQFGAEAFFDALAGMRDDHRFARYGSRVFKTSSGVAYVPTRDDARTVLALRSEPVIARHVAQRYAEANAQALAVRLGRSPRLGDLYLAHRVGLRLAVDFNERLAQRPDALAAIEVPDLDEAASELLFAGERATTLANIAAEIDRAADLATRRHALAGTMRAKSVAPVAAVVEAAASADRLDTATKVMGWHAEVRPSHAATGRSDTPKRRRAGAAVPPAQ